MKIGVYTEIEKTTLDTARIGPGQKGVAELIAQCRELAGIGIQQAIFNMPNVHEIAPLEAFQREIIPALADL